MFLLLLLFLVGEGPVFHIIFVFVTRSTLIKNGSSINEKCTCVISEFIYNM